MLIAEAFPFPSRHPAAYQGDRGFRPSVGMRQIPVSIYFPA
ncbi:hypothetical protein D083_1874 [Dickeya solani RNS 08.23.3.1.A]|nr:hypothetical protein D083_1874 [Dickeya solani RNS 08.23.3.1.A]